MIQTIRADFYRLFHSKGFWITEFVLLANILLGVLYKVTSRFGTSISTDSQDVAQQVPEKMTGINALAHFSGHSDSIIFFTLIIVCLLLGVDCVVYLLVEMFSSELRRAWSASVRAGTSIALSK